MLCQVYFRDTIPNGFGNFIYMVCFAILFFLVLANGFSSIKYIQMLNIRKLINTLNLVTITPAVPDKESNMKKYILIGWHAHGNKLFRSFNFSHSSSIILFRVLICFHFILKMFHYWYCTCIYREVDWFIDWLIKISPYLC